MREGTTRQHAKVVDFDFLPLFAIIRYWCCYSWSQSVYSYNELIKRSGAAGFSSSKPKLSSSPAFACKHNNATTHMGREPFRRG
jgi:hypothetical protein